ncbi:ABC transporter permease [Botrimarina mediterranea]|uniref:Transport permease protein n=1 Tax=Botrimarina mediterranea TaxID=2528022 RepID=A0A518KBG0_9BACT|nr:ABC transporter permease [Botrimarina mediterranea]QDV75123.1 Teichoic acid translocation permease protein TagG [Botrimarina mediterranea]QDV79768.1 Teichoic acid translocation permease protein TagG [Planctomycetes bacterium K2D]
MPPAAANRFEVVIEPRRGFSLVDLAELHAYRDLFRFLVWRQVKVRYAQSAIGIGWAVIQPVFSVLLFTVVFGKLAQIESDGVPYALFSFAALVPWTYFSNALTEGVGSLVSEANMLRKVYFPRIMMPLSAVVAKLVDFVIAMGCLGIVMLAHRHLPPWEIVFMPLLTLLMVAAAAAVSIWLTALAVQYRDVKHALSFVVQLGMYASPVVYPASLIPERFQLLYALNPMVGVIEGFRACLLGTQPMPWGFFLVGSAVTALLLVTGLAFFRKRETVFADVA